MLPWPFEETGTPSSGSNSVSSLRRRSSSARTMPNSEVAPGGLGERAAVAVQRLEVAAGRVVAVDQHAERPEAEVLGHRGADAGHHRRAGHERPRERVDGAEHRPVRHVQRQPGRGPRRPARHELAEQLHVVVARAEHPLVERLLGGPCRRGRRASQRPVEWSPKLHSPQRNDTGGAGYSLGRWPHAPSSATTSARAAAASTRSCTGRSGGS